MIQDRYASPGFGRMVGGGGGGDTCLLVHRAASEEKDWVPVTLTGDVEPSSGNSSLEVLWTGPMNRAALSHQPNNRNTN